MSSVVDRRSRHLPTVNDYSREEIVYLIDLAAELKAAKQEGREKQKLLGKETAPAFGDESHPIQLLADFLTFDEHLSPPLDEVSFCYLGDASTAMAATYLIGGAKLGMDVRIAAPRSLWPAAEVLDRARRIASADDGRILVTDDVEEAVVGCDVLITDVWASIGETADVWGERIHLLITYQVNTSTIALTGNPDVKFMHCQPALRNTGTTVGKELSERYGLNALEVTDEVLASPASLVLDQAENRMHAIKAVLVATADS